MAHPVPRRFRSTHELESGGGVVGFGVNFVVVDHMSHKTHWECSCSCALKSKDAIREKQWCPVSTVHLCTGQLKHFLALMN
jgi:hypothetical protein